MGVHIKLLVCCSIWLLPFLTLQGQNNSVDPSGVPALNVSTLNSPLAKSNPAEARAKLIFAHGRDVENSFAASRPTPAYTDVMDSRVGQLSVDWVTPGSIMIDEESAFELVVRNRGPVAVRDVRIEPLLPAASQLLSSNPSPSLIDEKPIWNVPVLEPQEEFRLQLGLVLHSTGPARTDARITYSTSAGTSFRVVEPKLQIRVDGPDNGIVGNQLFFQVSVTNPGTGPVDNTSLQVVFPEGIQCVAEGAMYDIGLLNPGESRSIRVPGNLTQLGEHICEFVATSDHGLRDQVSQNVVGRGADIDIEIIGPAFRYVNRPADYSMRIRNSGTAAANEMYFRTAVPQPFVFVQANQSGNFDSVNKDITWFVDRLNAGEEVVVTFRLQATTPGSIPILAEAVGQRGIHVETSHTTVVEGIAAILLEVVDVDDPVEVGAPTFYEIIVTNQGTAFAKDIVLTAEVPEEMEITGSQGPSEGLIQGRTVRFELAKLAPRADAIYRVKVRGLAARDVRIRVQVDAESLDEPVLELESTKVYQD